MGLASWASYTYTPTKRSSIHNIRTKNTDESGQTHAFQQQEGYVPREK
jgi:hypothetical protein